MTKQLKSNNYTLKLHINSEASKFSGLQLLNFFLGGLFSFIFTDFNFVTLFYIIIICIIFFIFNYIFKNKSIKIKENYENNLREESNLLIAQNNRLSNTLTLIINHKLQQIFKDLSEINGFPKENSRLRIYHIEYETNYKLIGNYGVNNLIIDNSKINNEYNIKKSTLLSFCLKKTTYNCYQENLNIDINSKENVKNHYLNYFGVKISSYTRKKLKTKDFVSIQLQSQINNKIIAILILECEGELIKNYKNINYILNNNSKDMSILLDNIYQY